MIDFENIENVYFLGIGGIGMSALARFANHAGKKVYGYDLTETPLTQQLQAEGIDIHYTENITKLSSLLSNYNTLVVRTPAVPESHGEYQYFLHNGYSIMKRSELLGFLTQGRDCIAVAGTHGKTSVSTMIAHIMKTANLDFGAFLGGISRNFGSNLVLPINNNSPVVTEADEYDRSFLTLSPSLAVVTAIDADHLDIYHTHQNIIDAFEQFASNIIQNGILLIKAGLNISLPNEKNLKVYTYSLTQEADFEVKHLRIEDGKYHFTISAPGLLIRDIIMTYPGKVNVENILAASAATLLNGCDPIRVKEAIATYRGVERRFDIQFQNNQLTYIDDYAHHPAEIEATILSVKELYAGKKILGVFQPHLYSRTRDFALEFAKSLDLLDEVILLDIYPARELPIPGVSSNCIFELMKNQQKTTCTIKELLPTIRLKTFDVLITMGAGNIDMVSKPICEMLKLTANE
jgi:UDP-N-acetylmuramate--alanine ligase